MSKFHAKKHGKTLALCDTSILGKTFQEGNKFLHITPSFYQGSPVSEKEAISLINQHHNGVISGNQAVELALRQKVVSQYKTAKNIKYAVYTRID